MRTLLYAIFFVLMSANVANACSCVVGPERAFEIARKIPVVAKLQILETHHDYYIAAPKEVFKGVLPQTFEIQKNGDPCYPRVDELPEHIYGLEHSDKKESYRVLDICTMHAYSLAKVSEYGDLVNDPTIVFYPRYYARQYPQIAMYLSAGLSMILIAGYVALVLRRRKSKKESA